MMQHRDIAGQPIRIDLAAFKQEKQDRETAIRISHLSMASKRIVEDYPELAGWYCLRVKDRAEFAVEKLLEESDVIAFVARHAPEIVIRRGRKWTVPARPWLPGYVLVRIVSSAAALHGLRQVRDVRGVVGAHELAYRIPDKVVETFMKSVSAANAQAEVKKAEEGEFMKGQILRVIDGPFASFEALVTENVKKDDQRIRCEVSIFGRSTPLELPLASVEKL